MASAVPERQTNATMTRYLTRDEIRKVYAAHIPAPARKHSGGLGILPDARYRAPSPLPRRTPFNRGMRKKCEPLTPEEVVNLLATLSSYSRRQWCGSCRTAALVAVGVSLGWDLKATLNIYRNQLRTAIRLPRVAWNCVRAWLVRQEKTHGRGHHWVFSTRNRDRLLVSQVQNTMCDDISPLVGRRVSWTSLQRSKDAFLEAQGPAIRWKQHGRDGLTMFPVPRMPA